MSARLPVLENVRVASPCSEPWESMTGDDRVRHCARCDLDVFDLSAMTREEAAAFVAGRLGGSAGRTCVQFFQRKDGTMLTRDCPVGWRRIQRRMALAAGAVASFLVLGAVAAFAGTRTLTCHTNTTDPLGSPLLQRLVSIFKAQPPPPPPAPHGQLRGEMVYIPPPQPAPATTP